MSEEFKSYFRMSTLDSNNRKDVWDPSKLLGTQEDILPQEHQLSINHIMVEAEKINNLNVVEIETIGYKEQPVNFPIEIKLDKCTLMQLSLLFPNPPVKFHLARGSGPVYLIGNHSVHSSEEDIGGNTDGSDQEEEIIELDEDDGGEEQEEILERSNGMDNTYNITQPL